MNSEPAGTVTRTLQADADRDENMLLSGCEEGLRAALEVTKAVASLDWTGCESPPEDETVWAIERLIEQSKEELS